MVHMASVWVPFTSESKEAVADYDEIRAEMRRALQECGRKLGTYLRRRKRMRREAERRTVFERYIGEIAKSCEVITGVEAGPVYRALLEQAKRKTEEADYELDEEGRVVDDGGRLAKDDGVIIVEERQAEVGGDEDEENGSLFVQDPPARPKRVKTRRPSKSRKKR
jgi:DNA topoisomerase-6 subunit B